MRMPARCPCVCAGTSYLNRTEASSVEKAVTRLLQAGLSPDQVGVITPYEGQRAHVVATMLRSGTQRQDLYKEIEVGGWAAEWVRAHRWGGAAGEHACGDAALCPPVWRCGLPQAVACGAVVPGHLCHWHACMLTLSIDG